MQIRPPNVGESNSVDLIDWPIKFGSNMVRIGSRYSLKWEE